MFGGDKMTGFIILFIFAISALLIALFMILGDKKYAAQKTKYVDIFIQQHKIHVSDIFIGSYFDLVHDARTKTIWFFHLHKKTLQFKEMPYAQIHQVKWEIDKSLIHSTTSKNPLKRDLLTKKTSTKEDVDIEVHDQYRVKEAMLSILIDETEPKVFDLVFISVNRPKPFEEVKQSDIAKWYDLFVSIIEENDNLDKVGTDSSST